jgi:hypothetical protein
MRRRLALLALPVAAVATLGFSSVASAAPFGISSTVLTGGREVPGPGDDDGLGRAIAQPKPGQGTVCIGIRYRNIDAPTGAHIHEGPPDVAGPIVIDFTGLIATSPAGQIKGCVAVDPALAQDVADNPGDYYVNVHNVAFPAGAIRGQLGGQ